MSDDQKYPRSIHIQWQAHLDRHRRRLEAAKHAVRNGVGKPSRVAKHLRWIEYYENRLAQAVADEITR